MSAAWVRAWLRASAAAVADRRAWLTDLDAAIGDGDHGINLDRGLRRVLETLDDPATDGLPAGALLEAAGRVILGSVGGASGALYGRALQRAGAAITADADGANPPRFPGTTRAATETEAAGAPGPQDPGPRGHRPQDPGRNDCLRVLAHAFDAAVEAISSLGRSAPGDKTMLDALVPASQALHASIEEDGEVAAALARAADAAARGVESTRPLVARRGRASYLGERSAGHLDPGAASTLLLVRALASTCPLPSRDQGSSCG